MDKYLPIPINKTYFACSNGKIFNKHGKELGGGQNKGGYSVVSIKDRETNKFISMYVHRIIWETFNGKIPDGMEIDHINTIKNDNRLENLRLVTPKENSNNPITIENFKKSNKQILRGFRIRKEARQVYQYTLDDELVKIWSSVMECERNGYNHGNVSQCCNGKSKTYKGFKWSYKPL